MTAEHSDLLHERDTDRLRYVSHDGDDPCQKASPALPMILNRYWARKVRFSSNRYGLARAISPHGFGLDYAHAPSREASDRADDTVVR